MHIVHIVPALFGEAGVFGGAERYVYELCRAMAARARVTLLCFGDRSRRFSSDGFEVVVLRNRMPDRLVMNPLGFGLLRILRDADVIHCHQTHTVATSAALLIGKILRRPIFTTELGGGGVSLYSFRNVDRWFDGHLHLSQYSKQVHRHEALAAAEVIYGGVDTDKFSPAEQRGISERPVLFVGRLRPLKGVDYLVQAMDASTPLLIVGRKADDCPDYFGFLQRLAAGKNVSFATSADDSQLVQHYRNALCLVLPSVQHDVYGNPSEVSELLGQTILEGMACGLPVIATNICSLPELVVDGETGFLVPPNDPQALGEKIRYLQTNPADAQRMGEAARARVLRLFTWPQVVERCLATYAAALREKSSNESTIQAPAPQLRSRARRGYLPEPGPLHIITPEFPPDVGGIADYTRVVAAELARIGEDVHVWTRGDAPESSQSGITVHRCFGDFGLRGLRRASLGLNRFPYPRRILVQWTPHSFGWRALNLPFCFWIWQRADRDADHVEIMFHEVRVANRGTVRQRVASLVQRLMVWILTRAARKLWMSTLAWQPWLSRSGKPLEWLPVPSTVPGSAPASEIAAVRQRFAGAGDLLIGHFGTGSPLVMALLVEVLREIFLQRSDVTLLLIGAAGSRLETLRAALPEAAERIQGTGLLDSAAVPAYLQACDLMLQVYVDGISTRRTSAMAALANGCALVSTSGPLTEPLWLAAGCLALAPAQDPRRVAQTALELLADPAQRRRLQLAARDFYRRHFDVALAAARLRATENSAAAKVGA